MLLDHFHSQLTLDVQIWRPSARKLARAVLPNHAASTTALVLRGASYPPVFYIPRKDVDMSMLRRTDHATYCPYKGDAAYFSIPTGGERSKNAVWTYESPYEALEEIGGHVAFYPDRVDALETN
ncbi:DUF427 domain-containing protein [Rhizobium leguminosarum]|nr:DUF427 domain-containing protein [Rhizobium leguminosarum]TAV94181.1 DUF427 domain-containing protein [Rhizobium leguminosarum]TAW35256.1 DUF427 domain-containing protein [Rhizobium leguminosarum]